MLNTKFHPRQNFSRRSCFQIISFFEAESAEQDSLFLAVKTMVPDQNSSVASWLKPFSTANKLLQRWSAQFELFCLGLFRFVCDHDPGGSSVCIHSSSVCVGFPTLSPRNLLIQMGHDGSVGQKNEGFESGKERYPTIWDTAPVISGWCVQNVECLDMQEMQKAKRKDPVLVVLVPQASLASSSNDSMGTEAVQYRIAAERDTKQKEPEAKIAKRKQSEMECYRRKQWRGAQLNTQGFRH